MRPALLLLMACLLIACGKPEHTESGPITSVAEDAKAAKNAAKDAVSAAEEAARRVEQLSQPPPADVAGP
jgi:uncharacterized protein (UPF0333 family)